MSRETEKVRRARLSPTLRLRGPSTSDYVRKCLERSTHRYLKDQSIEAQIVDAIGSGAGGGAQGLFYAHEDLLSLTPTKVSAARCALGLWPDCVQAVDATRPAFDDDGFNGHPCLSYSGMQLLVSANHDLSGMELIAISSLIKIPGSTVGVYTDFTLIANGMLRTFSDANTRLSAMGRAAPGLSETRSAASYATPEGVVRGAVDYTLASQSTRIWLNAVDISASFAADPNLSGQAVGNGPLLIGNRMTADLGLNGLWAATLVSAWPTTPFPTAQLAVAEQVLLDAWAT